MAQHIKDFCEDRARKGDGLFAIAYALIDLSDSQEATAKALSKMGFGTVHSPGALEGIAMKLSDSGARIAESLDGIGSAISDIDLSK